MRKSGTGVSCSVVVQTEGGSSILLRMLRLSEEEKKKAAKCCTDVLSLRWTFSGQMSSFDHLKEFFREQLAENHRSIDRFDEETIDHRPGLSEISWSPDLLRSSAGRNPDGSELHHRLKTDCLTFVVHSCSFVFFIFHYFVFCEPSRVFVFEYF